MSFRTGKDPVQLTATDSTIYTVPASRRPTLIELGFINLDTVNRTPTVHFVPSGQLVATSRRVIGGTESVIKPGETQIYRFRQFLAPSDFISWKADAATAISAWCAVVEETEDVALFRNVNADFLTASLVSQRVIATGRQASLIEVILHNTDTVDRVATVHFIPSGGAAGNANIFVGGTVTGAGLIKPGETITYAWNQHRGAGVDIQAKADTASVVVAKLSVLEEEV